MTGLRLRPCIGLDPSVADEHAHRPAILGPDGRNYAELDAEVSALAAGLSGLGVGRGSRVAIWMDKSTRYVITILATLRAGAAYVPLDGDQPANRVATILADARPEVLVSDQHRLAALQALDGPSPVPAICVEAAGQSLDHGGHGVVLRWADLTRGGSAAPLDGPARPDDLAALLYTSGSTGTPKGVQISHRNLAAFIDWAAGELDVDERDVFTNHASFNFDLSTLDLFLSLRVGAAIWLIDSESARDVSALTAGIRRHRVTVMYCVPSIYNLLATSGALSTAITRSLRYVLFAGEAYPTPQVARLAELLPTHAQLYNLYGPTETNVCTYYRVRQADLASDEPLPIGTPLPGVRLRIEQPDTDGVGELVVAGDCVTPGYWKREPESQHAGHPMGEHRTGDLVGYRDGLLVYRGRKDRMVKLSGYRVELAEIEIAALRHPAVAETAALVVNTPAGPRLILCYTTHPGCTEPGLIELKQHCARHLPRYMVPQAAHRLLSLPRNANGKTDYRQLAEEYATAVVARAAR